MSMVVNWLQRLHFRRLFSVMLVTCMSIRIKERHKMVAVLTQISLRSPGTVARQAPVSMGFPWQEYWSGSLLSCSVLLDSWQPYGLQQAGFPALHHLRNLLKLLSIESVMTSNHPILFSACFSSFPASGSFPMSLLFTSGSQSIGASDSASVLPVNIQGWFPLGFVMEKMRIQSHKAHLGGHSRQQSMVYYPSTSQGNHLWTRTPTFSRDSVLYPSLSERLHVLNFFWCI